MISTKFISSTAASTIGLLQLLFCNPVIASEKSVNLRFSLVNSWQARNDVQIPNTSLGTRFSLSDATEADPLATARLEINWAITDRHGMRILLAPFSYKENVVLPESVRFNGETFETDEIASATYKFNSWRIGYHYSLINNNTTTFKLGGTLKIRDAEIGLAQGEVTSLYDNVGVVPLLYIAGSYRISERLKVRADLDGLAGGRGRAIDAGLALDFHITNRLTMGTELRVLDGGADNDRVYNFAQFSSAAIVIGTSF